VSAEIDSSFHESHFVHYCVSFYMDNLITLSTHTFFRCGECKSIAGIWEELAFKFNKPDSDVVVAKVDCQAEQDLCSYQDITDYPTYMHIIAIQRNAR